MSMIRTLRSRVSERALPILLLWLLALGSELVFASASFASPIYVYKDPDGTIHFSSSLPPPGVTAQVFTARSSSFSYYSSLSNKYKRDKLYKNVYNDLIQRIAKYHALDPALIKAVIHVESAFNAHAVSPKGAQGLMQLMPGTARLMGVSRPFRPEENIMGGTKYLSELLQRFGGNVRLALAAYNAGPGAVTKWQGIPPYPETQQYVSRVLQMHARYSSL